MPKRDLIAEIADKRERALKGKGRYAVFDQRWFGLLGAHELIAEHHAGDLAARRELLRLIPVGLVACLEAFTRLAVRDLIDAGAPYQDNASRLEDTRIDMRTLIGMGKAKVTAGEFIAHMLPISSLEDINRHMTVLLGADFWTELKKLPRGPGGTLVADLARYLITDLTALFEARHIICHETGKRPSLSLASTQTMLQATLVFGDAFESLMRQCLHQRPLPAN